MGMEIDIGAEGLNERGDPRNKLAPGDFLEVVKI